MAKLLDGELHRAMISPRMVDARARRILFATYWGSTGWRANFATAPDDFTYAKAAGYMFDPWPYEHAGTLERALALRERVPDRLVADRFVASLASRRLDLRSALGSSAILRNMPLHDFSGRAHCNVCGGYREARAIDVNVFNFERLRWGGVRHNDVDYNEFDLDRALVEPADTPTDADSAALRAMLQRAGAMPAGARPGDLEKELRGVLPSNTNERRTLLAILGYCGVLQPAGRTGFFGDFTPRIGRDPPLTGKSNDWEYPVSWWRGSDGVNEDAARYWFGHYLLNS